MTTTPAEDTQTFDEFIYIFALDIAQELVDEPSQTSVSISTNGRSMVATIRTPKSEIGKIIGKSGRIINAIRTLLGAMAAKEGVRLIVEVVEHTNDD